MIRRAAALVFLCACGPAGDVSGGDAGDASDDALYGKKPIDAGIVDVGQPEITKTAWDRMTSHGGQVISSLSLRALYITSGSLAPKNFDALLAWTVTSTDYWSLLAQYGVGYGTVLESATMDASDFFQPGDVVNGLIGAWTLDTRLEKAFFALPPPESGTANAYIVFLPPGVDVDLGGGKTCSWALGYHSSTFLPVSVIPACGASAVTITHELAEMVTDPNSGGWYSDADINPAGGEIGDLCNFPINVDGNNVTQLWSNADGDCEPH